MLMKGIFTMGILSLLIGCRAESRRIPKAWEHGWKTHRVIATRYFNDGMGYSVGFKFPMDPNDCDRAEISEFFEDRDGWIFQGGGYPGAEAFVKFKGVTDRSTADEKLKKILPDLDKLMDDIASGKKISRTGRSHE